MVGLTDHILHPVNMVSNDQLYERRFRNTKTISELRAYITTNDLELSVRSVTTVK